ncbi:MAG: TaqI-like C-terminal specificity domain-containing protein, partial [Candidatus Binatus sp.]
IEEKKRILTTHIFGVDIDRQAVEVSKLSLLLKVLEGETDQSLSLSQLPFGDRALPNLANNIKCGNSLVGPDYFIGKMFPDPEEMKRVNAFDWKQEFPQAMKAGGFDSIIGNPPYSYRNATEDLLRDYYVSRFLSTEGNFDLYKFFLERSTELTRDLGIVGFIVSATFLVQPTFSKLRKLLLDRMALVELAPLGPRVFTGATVDTSIIIAKKLKSKKHHLVRICTPSNPIEIGATAPYHVRQSRFGDNANFSFDYKLSEGTAAIVSALFVRFPPIERGFEFGVGINTGFIREELTAPTRKNEFYHRMVPGSGIARYGAVSNDGWIMYSPDYVRRRGKLGRSLPPERFFKQEKILVVRTRNLSLPRRIIATIDRSGSYNLNRLTNIIARPRYSLLGLLGILNSTLFNWLFSTRYFDYEIKPAYLRGCPLADCDENKLVRNVERMLALHHQLTAAKSEARRATIQRQIDATDAEIDRLVYDLYGLTAEEIAMVEEASAKPA